MAKKESNFKRLQLATTTNKDSSAENWIEVYDKKNKAYGYATMDLVSNKIYVTVGDDDSGFDRFISKFIFNFFFNIVNITDHFGKKILI